MTAQALREYCKDRKFDRIVVVVKDIFAEIEALHRILKVLPGDVRICTNETDGDLTNESGVISYTQRQASYYFENLEYLIVEPVSGDTIYQRYLEKYGPCICCVRETMSKDRFDGMLAALKDKNVRTAQEAASTVWLDLTDELGILFAITCKETVIPENAAVIPQKVVQLNITTPNVKETIERMTDLLCIGPWEVGLQSPVANREYAFRVDDRLQKVDFAFHVAILPCGNLEWEAIEPVKGPLVYNDFLAKRGIGFHHILMEIPKDQWQETLKGYAQSGIRMACSGSIGPVDWCYMNTEDDLHFYIELRTDAVMDKLPDGYLEYFYPED